MSTEPKKYLVWAQNDCKRMFRTYITEEGGEVKTVNNLTNDSTSFIYKQAIQSIIIWVGWLQNLDRYIATLINRPISKQLWFKTN